MYFYVVIILLIIYLYLFINNEKYELRKFWIKFNYLLNNTGPMI